MPYQEFKENWQQFSHLVEKINKMDNPQLAVLMKRYVEQNLSLLNDIFATSIVNLQQLQMAKAPEEIICLQARFTNEVSKKLSLSAQRFLNASLGNIADYNEWLKAHCDLATD
jgi:hypothetical protein